MGAVNTANMPGGDNTQRGKGLTNASDVITSAGGILYLKECMK